MGGFLTDRRPQRRQVVATFEKQGQPSRSGQASHSGGQIREISRRQLHVRQGIVPMGVPARVTFGAPIAILLGRCERRRL